VNQLLNICTFQPAADVQGGQQGRAWHSDSKETKGILTLEKGVFIVETENYKKENE